VWFDKTVSRKYLKESRAVYGYEHSVFETFSRQRARGALNIYDMPTAHHTLKSQILDSEYSEYPEIQTSYSRHVQRQYGRRKDRTDGELALADLVICPSRFVKDSLVSAGISQEKVVVVPFGAPEVGPRPTEKPRKPMVFLSAGNQSIPKGTHYLLEAWRKLSPPSEYELWLVGRMALPEHMLKDLPANVVIKNSVPRSELFEIYERSSVLILPTLFEGFALVITEAMAHGLAVITTPNSGGEGFINDGEHGLIVPIKDADSLAEAINRCIQNPDDVAQMGARAFEKAAGWQWSDYRRSLATVISKFLGSNAA
jgi:glycosyltransferase involved in cell wall biosynthesis